MADTWRLLLTPPSSGAWNMAVDEAVLEHIGRGQSQPTLRLFAWVPPCLSLGFAQPIADVDLDRLQQRGWGLVRRPTGGRAILHTDELTYSIIAAEDEPRVAGSVLESYNRLAAALQEAVKSLHLPVEIKEGKDSDQETPNPICFETPSAYEITVEGKKLIGSAQARRKEGVLQHGSLPLTGDLKRITEVLSFPDEAARRSAARRLLEHATTVHSSLGREVKWNDAAQAFVWGFESKLELALEEGVLSDGERKRADELVLEKYGRSSWNYKV